MNGFEAMNHVRLHAEIFPPDCLSLAYFIAGYMPNAFPSVELMAEKHRCDKRTILRRIGKLEKLGLIIVNRTNRNNIYNLRKVTSVSPINRCQTRVQKVTPVTPIGDISCAIGDTGVTPSNPS